MKVAIVGSRDFTDERHVQRVIEHLFERFGPALTIVSGGARGVDTMAETHAKRLGIPTIIHHANWAKEGKSAGMNRNILIVHDSEMVVAFFSPGPRSRGTSHTVRLARDTGRELRVWHDGMWFRS